ncbi:MAG: glycosyltransferase [Acidobacteria bacterium]|nr:glycosyltransferase [Acidobacteriota bacterium]
MRFCLLSTFFPPHHFGGDAVFVASLANLLAEAGHHVEAVHCGDSFDLLARGVSPSPFPIHPKVIVHTLRSPLGAIAPLVAHCTGKDWTYGARLQQIIGQGFDVTHWHNASLLGAPQSFRWGSGLRLMTLHEYWLVCPSHVLFRNGTEACDNRTCYTCTMSRGRPPQLWRSNGVIGSGLENIDLFLAPSDFVQETVSQFLPSLPIQVLPNFLPDRPRLNLPRENFCLIVSRLEAAKGVQTVLPLFRENGLPLKIAGAGEHEPELRALAAGAPNIEFLGRVPFDQLPSLYSRARATIVPSICHETFGLVVLESLQQGTPVFTSEYGALPSIIAETGGGGVFRNTAELAGLLETARPVEPDLTRFSPPSHLQSYLEAIKDAKSGRRTPALA